MSKEKEFRFECVRCGKCCTDENTLVNVTYFDILRIYKTLNLSIDELIHILGFFIFKKEILEEYLLKLVISPIKTEKGLGFVGLRKLENYQCYFYNNDKKECLIYNIRPYFCRTFPFSFKPNQNNEDKSGQNIEIVYTEKGKQYCIGINDKAPLINKQKLINLGKTVIDVLKKNDNIIKEWNSYIKKNRIEPSVRSFLRYILNLNI